MADMHHLVEVEGVDADAAYSALTTSDGVTAWWTSRAEVPGARVGDVLRLSFPDTPMTWDMRIAETDGRTGLRRECLGGPPGWPGTEVAWGLEKTGSGAVVRLDHTGFSTVDDMFRIVTVGWSRMLLSLKAYLESGRRQPFFDF